MAPPFIGVWTNAWEEISEDIMDKEVAKHIVRMSFRAKNILTQLIPLLKKHCSDEEYQVYVRAIAHAIYQVGLAIEEPVYAAFPGMAAEIEQEVNKYQLML